ncbi:hypothetical protein [Croceivirga thetidis]|uniref:Uncharacterized protein n=1 Tax=Croceivirga thetidis TaxID=2721623 RepID=A0ABX1GT60_9FLAO|nr:hypothetical protein [Croceivirga thetidis]NKI33106.1 hypothetical protein [Croceivirga thetidis]
MNAKWYASTLFILLVLFGLSKAPNKALNQQIVLQFVDLELASETDHAKVLADIQHKLKLLGIEAIEIVENDQRQISVRYYSEIDVETVERFLTNENQTATSNGDEFPTDFPKENESKNYQLVVSDLYAKVDGSFNTQGTLVSNQNKSDVRQTSPFQDTLSFGATLDFNTCPSSVQTLKINSNILIAFDKFSYRIPEIRAGPSHQINA